MKENLKLFWQNITNNKYWIGLIIFAFMITELTREKINGYFDGSKFGYWLCLSILVAGFLGVLVGAWLTRDSQKE